MVREAICLGLLEAIAGIMSAEMSLRHSIVPICHFEASNQESMGDPPESHI